MSSDWFYHAPHKRTQNEAPNLPVMSQIPGLSDLAAEEKPQGNPGVLIRDTDSNYIKLAKMGGRKNLLCFQQGQRSQEPKPYPVPEWWGAAKEEPVDPMAAAGSRPKAAIPDYMVHEPYCAPRASDDMMINRGNRARVPFGQDGQSHWRRDSQGNIQSTHNIVIQKQKRLLEPIEPRIRNVIEEKPAGLVIRPRAKTAKELSTNTNSFRPELPLRMKTFISSNEAEQPSISKVLCYGYQREWLQEREKQQKIDNEKRNLYAQNLAKTLSEKGYNITDDSHQPQHGQYMRDDHHHHHHERGGEKRYDVSASRHRQDQPQPWRTTSKTAHHGQLTPNSNLYKMKRFQKVQSKVGIPAA